MSRAHRALLCHNLLRGNQPWSRLARGALLAAAAFTFFRKFRVLSETPPRPPAARRRPPDAGRLAAGRWGGGLA
jgi:hypothetical protein